ncbi:unnamed protein product [Mytilus edulis]|uniref:DZIP3-like HEPN domain-containing protein n=1 Tax=Mytilus edulis TaxID=6550 RepID=A0A8S3SBT8_MYTED|nr:unnamed protein product [Mytilus edulis]
MTSVYYEISWTCGLSKPEAVTRTFDFSEEKTTEYYCRICGTTHKFSGEWSDLPSNSSSHSYGDIEADPESEIPVEHKTFTSTKVLIKGSNCFSTNAFQDLNCASSKAELSKEELNFSKMGLISFNILADALYDRLKLDGHNVHIRKEYDITKLYNEHRHLNINRPTIGDDIERIRLTRNELQHSATYEITDTRFVELRNIIQDLLERFDQRNKPTVLYSERLEEVLAKSISDEDAKYVRQQLECKINTGNVTFQE